MKTAISRDVGDLAEPASAPTPSPDAWPLKREQGIAAVEKLNKTCRKPGMTQEAWSPTGKEAVSSNSLARVISVDPANYLP